MSSPIQSDMLSTCTSLISGQSERNGHFPFAVYSVLASHLENKDAPPPLDKDGNTFLIGFSFITFLHYETSNVDTR